MTWEYEEEIEEFPLIIWIVVALGFGGLALVIATQARKQTMAKSYTAYEEGQNGDDGQEEAVAEETPEESEEAEEVTDEDEGVEEKTSSIYDLKSESED